MEALTAFPPAPEAGRTAATKKRPAAKKTVKAPTAKAPEPPAKPAAKKTAKKAVAKKAAKAARATAKKAETTPDLPIQPAPAPAPTPAPVAHREPEPQKVEAPIAAVVHKPEPAPVAAPVETVAPPAPQAQTVSAANDTPSADASAPAVTAEAPQPAEQTPRQPGEQPQQQGQGHRDDRHGKFGRHGRDRHRDRDRGERFQKPQHEPQPERPLGPPEPTEGILELTPKGYGFLRQKSRQWAQLADDPFVSPEWIRKIGLREGMFIKGTARMGHRGPQVTEIQEVMGRDPETIRDLPLFEELKAINPNKRIQLETKADRLTTRVMDLITPVGRGQRGLIVAPPRAGKTTLLQHIAEAITQNHPQIHLMMLLVDERPEEVTEFRRCLPGAEILASSNDSELKSHIRIASFAIERAKRLVECGQHVFILLDSITRMARSFNNAHKGGATATGGLGVGALESPRRLFAAARNTREAGSLTILATALIETNSRMDDAIFQEFKGTGNLELVLDRKIAEQYIYPAVNIFKSGTRREELLLPAFQMEKVHLLRRGLAGHKPIDAIQRVITLMERSPNNTQMLIDLPMKGNTGN
jgi:transcription termination factor Rho